MNEYDFYQSYNAERYIHFRTVPTGKYEIIETKRNGKLITNRKPIFEKQKLSFEDVKNINLDNYGQDVRTSSEDFTLVHNYLLDFWSAIMGADAVLLYIHLKRYCFSGKDFCYPNMKTIQEKMKKGSKSTINKNMDILEKYGFIAKIQRIDTERNNGYASPFFKVRRYVPLLSQELIEQLPETLHKEHDKFLANANGVTLDETIDNEDLINDLMRSSKLMKSKSQSSKEEVLKRQGRMKEYILAKLSTQEQKYRYMFLQYLEKKFSKPSYETWFRDSIFILDQEHQLFKIYVANSFALEWINNQYKDVLQQMLKEILDLEIKTIEISLYEDYLN
ncbi:DnaA N-terminal domain-containing protein [Oceanobacillus kimchii]|uniref:DnaA N-terminal domain-containing protein n=1 Tax=Oceanobacillus kimchii TaxID=746691 RepID=A0ABQ5TQ33_9BACI|nr:DnaA N-terminal domain-containing protein [Oceanobacillus kimchii]GLO68250.1 hypothetical protein MACH08_40340 [Oceanobacillus kimchii]